jgi:hypothetical protein
VLNGIKEGVLVNAVGVASSFAVGRDMAESWAYWANRVSNSRECKISFDV